MCLRLDELKSAMLLYATAFDVALLSCTDASIVVKQASAIEHMAATVKSLAAARAAEARAWKTDGHRSPEEQLAHETGTSISGARDALNLGRRLATQPEVANAARRGDISPTQASAISDAAAANPAATPELINAATAGGSLAELRSQCSTIKAGTVDLEARRAEIHRRRGLRAWTDQDGMWHITGAGNPEDGAQIMAAVAPRADEAFEGARRQGRREHPDAYRFDGLVRLALDATSARHLDRAHTANGDRPRAKDGPPSELAAEDSDTDTDATGVSEANAGIDLHHEVLSRRRPTRAGRRRAGGGAPRSRTGAPAKLLIRVDLATFLRGFPASGETCELVGYGPVSVSAINHILNNADPFVAAILTKGKQLLGVAHLGRQPTAHQTSALEWLHPTCAAQGCPNSAHLESDHRIDWSKTHITLLDWLDSLCHHHHALKTRDNWALVDGTGKRPFVPPTDPRHPRNRKAA